MNETLKQFIQRNSYQLITATITAVIVIFGAYVALQLTLQSFTFQIQAMRKDISRLQDNSVQRGELQPINEKLEDIKNDVKQIVGVLLKK
jgi:hypothetical protein